MTTAGILRRPYLLATAGAWSLVFLCAFESLAVTTIMPIVTADLDGRSLYSLAFSAVLAAGVIGLVLTGAWADHRGPARPLLTSVALFALGLVLSGTAVTMQIFVAGRLLQGLGAGGMTVALYVLVAKVYPAHLHIKIFGAFASAWVLPSLVGPFVAGLVADALSWHWVFLGVVALVAVATAMVAPTLRGHDRPGVTGSGIDGRRAVAAVVVAVAVVLLGYGSRVEQWVAWAAAPVVLAVIAVAARRLLPPGTYRARPGLPAAVLLCGAAGAVFFGTEVYLPLLLQERYGLPAWLSGVTLTAAALSWALASAVQGRLGDRARSDRAILVGAVLLAVGVLSELLIVAATLPAWCTAAAWFVAGGGMGTLYPRVSALVLARSEPGREGFNTGAKSITDSGGASIALALAGLLAVGDPASRGPYVHVLILTSGLGVCGVLVARRAIQAGGHRL